MTMSGLHSSLVLSVLDVFALSTIGIFYYIDTLALLMLVVFAMTPIDLVCLYLTFFMSLRCWHS